MNRTLAWARLVRLFFLELFLSVKEVALTVLHPRRRFRSAIVAVPLELRSEAGIALFANMITLTPGTTSLHVDRERKLLYVHVMSVSDDTVSQLKNGFERRVLEVLP